VNVDRKPALGLPIAAVLLAMCSIQFGAALAKSLFPALGPVGATTLRLVLAALILLPVVRAWRRNGAGTPTTRAPTKPPTKALLGYGASLGFMNLFYYLALARVPMGLVVAIEFLGPLGVAIAATHRRVDFVWVALAALGLLLLLPLQPGTTPLDPLGILYALLAGLGWALYIVFGTRAGQEHGGRTVAQGMLIAAACVLPWGVIETGTRLLDPAVLPVALLVAVLSSVLPYTLEMFAMQRMPTRSFGIFMSLEPALAAVAGLLILGEHLSATQWLAVACVMAASSGSAIVREDPGA
jgi:inner membrane transporter RhtA